MPSEQYAVVTLVEHDHPRRGPRMSVQAVRGERRARRAFADAVVEHGQVFRRTGGRRSPDVIDIAHFVPRDGRRAARVTVTLQRAERAT